MDLDSSKGYCINGFSYDLHKSQNEKFVRNRKKSNWDLEPDFCSKTILTIFLEMSIHCIFLEMSKTIILGRFFFRQNPIRGNGEILCIQNTKDFSIRPYETRPSPISQNSIASHFMIPTSNHLKFFPPAPYKFTLHENNNGGTPVTQDADAHILNANM